MPGAPSSCRCSTVHVGARRSSSSSHSRKRRCLGGPRPRARCLPRAAGQTIVFLAVFPTLSAFYIQMLAQRFTAPVKVSLIFSMEPVFAALFAWTLGGELFLPARAAGGALIVLAMVVGELSKLSLLRGRKKEVLPV